MGRVKDREASFKRQNYAELRKQHQEEGTLFTDHTFPASDVIIGTDSIPPNIQWKRPPDICENPRLFVDIETSRVVRPGELSCNWVVSACAVLAGVRELCNRVIPNYWEQEWSPKYCGLFHFQFWRFGVWTDVVVDDYLPTIDNVLLTTQAGAGNEFWAALVEKAYAKLHGSYDALREGHLCDALVDFTGGVSEVVDLQAGGYADDEDRRAALLEMLLTEVADHSLMCFTVVAPVYTDIGTRTPLGLSRGHAYHVTAVKKVPLGETNLRTLFKGREKVVMVRLRDPREDGRRPPSVPSLRLPIIEIAQAEDASELQGGQQARMEDATKPVNHLTPDPTSSASDQGSTHQLASLSPKHRGSRSRGTTRQPATLRKTNQLTTSSSTHLLATRSPTQQSVKSSSTRRLGTPMPTNHTTISRGTTLSSKNQLGTLSLAHQADTQRTTSKLATSSPKRLATPRPTHTNAKSQGSTPQLSTLTSTHQAATPRARKLATPGPKRRLGTSRPTNTNANFQGSTHQAAAPKTSKLATPSPKRRLDTPRPTHPNVKSRVSTHQLAPPSLIRQPTTLSSTSSDAKLNMQTSLNKLNMPNDHIKLNMPSDDVPESEGQYAYSTATLSRLLSSNSDWSRVKESERQRLGLHFNDKAEFWMPLEDVVSQFTELVICRLLNRNLFAVVRREWREAVFSDSWRSGAFGTSADRSGGAEETMLRNPQYICDIKKQEEELLVQLLQYHEVNSESNGFTNFLINFFIIKVEENRRTRLHRQLDHTPTVVRLDHKRRREVNYRGSLAAGRYIIVPTTFHAGNEGHYMLRVFSQNDVNLRELTNDLPTSLLCSCISGIAEWVTVVTVHNAELTVEPGKWSSKLSPYCVVTCEGSKEKTKVSSDVDPLWETSFVFYRKDVDKPLRVQVLNRNVILPDEVLGESELPALVNHAPTPLAATLNSPHKPKDPDSPLPTTGVVHLTILTEDNLIAV